MQNRIFLKVTLVLAVVILLLGACQGKQDDTKKIEQTQGEEKPKRRTR